MPSVDDLCRSYLDLKYHFDPSAASAAGLLTHDGRLGRFDEESVRAHLSALRSVGGAVEELDVDDLQQEIDRSALLGEIRSTTYRLEHERPHQRNPGFWIGHVFQGLYAVLVRDPAATEGRAPATLERLKAIPAFLDSAGQNLDEPPSVFVHTALEMLGGGGQLIVQLSQVLAGEAPGLEGELNQATTEALEAIKKFGLALRGQIEPSADPHSFAIGEDQFARRLHHEHALEAGAPELWRYGLHLQEETDSRLQALAGEMGKRPWRELVQELKADSPEPNQLLATYRDEMARAQRFVQGQNLVSVPQGEVEVVATPAFLATLVPFAAYEPPPIYLGSRHGRFYVTLPDPTLSPEAQAQQRRRHCRHAIPAMVAHEAYPGHHLQLLTAQRLGSEVRRHLWTPIMVEGWALYCEQLMEETNYYPTRESRLFQLVNLLWRAVRVVLDVGLHTRGMGPSEAVDYMVEHLPIERPSAEAEVRRYCAWPTYQLCYAIGCRELLRLRDAYRDRAGGDFRQRRFHDELLGYGGIPVALARWGMDLVD